jgi:formate/nitrite transporter FocA (FNT family)
VSDETGSDGPQERYSSVSDRIQERMMRAQSGARDEADGAPRSASGAPRGGRQLEDLFTADEVFQRLAATADHELRRTPRMLWFSGMAAGFSIGLTFLSRMAFGAELGAPGEFPADILYPIGFIVIVLGRYQLFTENTLTPVTLVLTRLASIPALMRLWGVVFIANILGATLFVLLLSVPGTVSPEAIHAGEEIAAHGLELPLTDLFLKGIVAGGIVASMVWLLHAVRDSTARFLIVFLLMIMIPATDLFHCVTGWSEVFFAFIHGQASFADIAGFEAAVALGNILGGVFLVALINYGQTKERRFSDRDSQMLKLSWREFLFGAGLKREHGGAVAPELDRPGAQESPEKIRDA